jgi:Arc/MetJ-type ribon-helix-helix transcriptional regulator
MSRTYAGGSPHGAGAHRSADNARYVKLVGAARFLSIGDGSAGKTPSIGFASAFGLPRVGAYRSEYRFGMLFAVATEQIAVRLPGDLLAALDELVARGVYESRAAAARAGIETVLELDRRRSTDQAIIDGYQRVSPTQAEREAAISSLRDAILGEPW